jgi:hypothetical protein
MRMRYAAATASGLAILALAGCSTASTSPGSVTPAGATQSPTATSTTENFSLFNEPFGTQYSGQTLAISVSKPVPYTPSDSAMVQQQTGWAVAFDISVSDRNSTQPFPLMALNYQVTSGDTQDQEIQDSANNVGTSTATVLPEKSLTWKVAFSVPANADDLTVAVSSMGGRKTIVFTGST